MTAAAVAEPIAVCAFETPLGPMLGGATAGGVCLLEFTDRRALPTEAADLGRRLARPFGLPRGAGSAGHLDVLGGELADYFAGRNLAFSVPVDTPGSAFERAVWALLRQIPPGQTRSYIDLAVAVGKPGGARAVGRANGCNRVAIVVPCHRVIEAGGGLGGYGGGLERKRWLLDHERRFAGGGSTLFS